MIERTEAGMSCCERCILHLDIGAWDRRVFRGDLHRANDRLVSA
jgi:hypothetical protein